MTGEEIRALVERAKAAKAAGRLTPELESQIMNAATAGIADIKGKDPIAQQELNVTGNEVSGQGYAPGIQQLANDYGQEIAAGKDPRQMADEDVQGLAKGVDLFTGAAPSRLAIAKATGVYKPGEATALISGQGAPSGGEITERYPSLEGHPLAQTAVATALDLADPGLIIGGGELLADVVKGGGKKLFNRGMFKLEQAGIRAGKIPGEVSASYLEHGATNLDKAYLAKEKLAVENEAIAQAADKAGAKVPGFADDLQKLSDQLDKVIAGKDDLAAKAAEQTKKLVQDQLERIKPTPARESVEQVSTGLLDSRGAPIVTEKRTVIPASDPTPNVSEVIDIKRSFRGNLPENVYDILNRTSEGQKAGKEISSFAQHGAEKAVGDTLTPEVQTRFTKNNRDIGNFLTTEEQLFHEQAKELAKPHVSQTKAGLAIFNPKAAAVAKAAEIANSGSFQRSLGHALNKGTVAPRLISYPAAAAAKLGGQNIYKRIQNGNQ